MSAELLTTSTITDYIASRPELRDLVDAATLSAREIGDGNLNLVFLVEDARDRSLIIKQTLPYVRSDHSWKVTEDSIFREARGLATSAKYAAGFSPEYYGLDESRRLVAIEDLSDWTVWRSALDNEQVAPGAAYDVGRFEARFAFGTSYFANDPQSVQRDAADAINPELEQITEDLVFTEPYFEHEHNSWEPEVTPEVLALRDDHVRTQAARLKYAFLTSPEALIHGDLHTSSIFVRPETPTAANTAEFAGGRDDDASRVKVFDFEFGFYGPVAFDLGILLGNYALAQARDIALHTAEYRTAADTGDHAALPYFSQWLLGAYGETWRGFSSQWRTLWKGRVDPLFGDEFLERWLADTFRKSLGFAGAEIIRRTIGWAQMADINTLDHDGKVIASRFALDLGKALLERHETVSASRAFARLVMHHVPR